MIRGPNRRGGILYMFSMLNQCLVVSAGRAYSGRTASVAPSAAADVMYLTAWE